VPECKSDVAHGDRLIRRATAVLDNNRAGMTAARLVSSDTVGGAALTNGAVIAGGYQMDVVLAACRGRAAMAQADR